MARAYGSSAHLLIKRETVPAAEAGLVEALSSDRVRDDGPCSGPGDVG